MTLPITGYIKEKDGVYEFLEIYYNKSFHYILKNAVAISRSTIDYLKKNAGNRVPVDSLEALERKEKRRMDILDSLESIRRTKEQLESEKIRTNDSIENVRLLSKGKQYGIIFSYADIIDKYTAGFTISFLNLAKNKTIKYLWVTASGLNDVLDIEGTKTVKGIGPIGPGKTGIYNFSDLFYSRVISSIVVTNIKIQYFDGTEKILNRAALSQIMTGALNTDDD